jgi:hypothetical protein
MVANAFNPSTQDTEAGRSQDPGQHREILTQKTKEKKQQKKACINPTISRLTLNVNGLNDPVRR